MVTNLDPASPNLDAKFANMRAAKSRVSRMTKNGRPRVLIYPVTDSSDVFCRFDVSLTY